jgi:hypothetical protein
MNLYLRETPVFTKKLFLALACLPLLLLGCQSTQPLSAAAFRTQAASIAPKEALFNQPAADPFILKSRQGLLLAYRGQQADSRQIYLRQSRNGQDWGSPVQVSQSSLSVAHPQIVEDAQGKFKLFYHSNESEAWQIYLSESNDAQSWSPPRRVELPETQISDSTLLYSNKEYLLCYQAFGGGLYLTRSTDAQHWSKAIRISESGEAPSLVRTAQGNYALAYEGPTASGWTIYLSSSSNLTQWSAPQAMGQGNRSRWGRLVSGPKNTTLVFSSQSEDGSWELNKRVSTDLKNWNAPQELTHNGLRNTNPQLALASASSAYLAWELGQPESPAVSHLTVQQLQL